MAASRIDLNGRLHKRPQAKVNSLIAEGDGPYTEYTNIRGRMPRLDPRSYPYYLVGMEVWIDGAA